MIQHFENILFGCSVENRFEKFQEASFQQSTALDQLRHDSSLKQQLEVKLDSKTNRPGKWVDCYRERGVGKSPEQVSGLCTWMDSYAIQ